MTEKLTLIADVGGTNTRFALANSNGMIAKSAMRFANASQENFLSATQTYLASHHAPAVQNLCIAIAGPVSNGMGKLTNGTWRFDSDELTGTLGVQRVNLLNDLVALGHALDVLPAKMIQKIGGGEAQGRQALVAGVATGFNVSISNAGQVLEAELGHASLPGAVNAVLERHIGAKAHDFTTIEMLFSGQGLTLLHRALGGTEQTPAEISQNAEKTVSVFVELFSVLCQEMAYLYMPLAGMYLNGSVARAVLSSPQAKAQLAFLHDHNKAFSAHFAQMPIYLITADDAALYGCAKYALMD